MKKKFSFTRCEREILPNFRQKIGKAESTEDVKKFFVYTVNELFRNVFEGQLEFDLNSTFPSNQIFFAA